MKFIGGVLFPVSYRAICTRWNPIAFANSSWVSSWSIRVAFNLSIIVDHLYFDCSCNTFAIDIFVAPVLQLCCSRNATTEFVPDWACRLPISGRSDRGIKRDEVVMCTDYLRDHCMFCMYDMDPDREEENKE